jgi:hypothetical protein
VGDLVVIAPVLATRETDLREHLTGLRGSPIERLPLDTHFARWVVVPLDGPRLFFSSRFDGDAERYLDALAGLEEAAAIWSHCETEDDLHDPSTLRAFLVDHIVEASYLLPAWPKASVAQVNEALDRRAALSRFALETQGLDAVGLAHAFRERFVR